MTKSYIEIGRLKKTYGHQGALRYVLFDGYKDVLARVGHFFVLIDNIYVPFFPQSKFDEDANALKIEGISNEDEADKMKGKAIYIEAQNLPEIHSNEEIAEFRELEGYQLYNQENLLIGRIMRVEVFPMQEMAVLDNEKLIPLSEALIISLDTTDKKIVMDLPEGIMDI